MEIERKFILNRLPDLEKLEKKEIEQAYLCTAPVVRIRKSNEKYILTFKSKKQSDHAVVSDEKEMLIDKEAFEKLILKADNHVVSKTRYIIPIENGRKIELDVFKDRLKGLIFAEVEFESVEEASSFKLPDWFERDVSFDKRFGNAHLAKLDDICTIFSKEELWSEEEILARKKEYK